MATWSFGGIEFEWEWSPPAPAKTLPVYQQAVTEHPYVGGGAAIQVGPIPPKRFPGTAFVDGSNYAGFVAIAAGGIPGTLVTDNGSHSNMVLTLTGGKPGQNLVPSSLEIPCLFLETTP